MAKSIPGTSMGIDAPVGRRLQAAKPTARNNRIRLEMKLADAQKARAERTGPPPNMYPTPIPDAYAPQATPLMSAAVVRQKLGLPAEVQPVSPPSPTPTAVQPPAAVPIPLARNDAPKTAVPIPLALGNPSSQWASDPYMNAMNQYVSQPSRPAAPAHPAPVAQPMTGMRATYPAFNPAALPAYNTADNNRGYYGLPPAQQLTPAQRDQALALSSPDPYQREWARMQAEEAVKRSGQEVAANVQDALKTGRPGELGANFRPIWDAQQGINTARQYGDAREGSLYGARPSPQNAPILSGAYEGMAPSAFRTGPSLGTEGQPKPVRTDEMIQQEQMAALNARMGLAAGAGRDARMEVARDRLNDMYAAHPEVAADRVAAKATGLAQREAAKAKIAADVEQAGGFDAFMAMRRAESRAAVKNIRETGDPNTSLAMKRAEIQAKLGRYANEQLTDEGKAEYGRLRGALRTIESSRLRGPQENAAYDQLAGQIESSGLDSLIAKPKPPTIEIGGITYRTKYDDAGNMSVGDPLVDPSKSPPKDFGSFVRTLEGLKAWQSTREQLIMDRPRGAPEPTDEEIRQVLFGWWNAGGADAGKGNGAAGAYTMTPPASGTAAPQSGTDTMSVGTPQPIPSDPKAAVVGATYALRNSAGAVVTVRWDGQKYVSVN